MDAIPTYKIKNNRSHFSLAIAVGVTWMLRLNNWSWKTVEPSTVRFGHRKPSSKWIKYGKIKSQILKER